MSNKKRPSISLTPGNIAAIEQHAEKADREPSLAKPPTVPAEYPWEDPRIRADLQKVFNLRISEPYFEKLKWLSEQTGKSMHKIVIELVYQHIDKSIQSMTGQSAYIV